MALFPMSIYLSTPFASFCDIFPLSILCIVTRDVQLDYHVRVEKNYVCVVAILSLATFVWLFGSQEVTKNGNVCEPEQKQPDSDSIVRMEDKQKIHD